jgi:hypothetical protein
VAGKPKAEKAEVAAVDRHGESMDRIRAFVNQNL